MKKFSIEEIEHIIEKECSLHVIEETCKSQGCVIPHEKKYINLEELLRVLNKKE